MTSPCKRCRQTSAEESSRYCTHCRRVRQAALDETMVRILVASVVLTATGYFCWTCQEQAGFRAAHAAERAESALQRAEASTAPAAHAPAPQKFAERYQSR